MVVDVNATLHPRQFSSWSLNELKDVTVPEIEVAHHSSVFVDPASTECFIQG
jgi:hypothetical protein